MARTGGPLGAVRRIGEGTHLTDHLPRGELGAAQPFDDVAAHHGARALQLGQEPVGGREPARCPVGGDPAPGDHPVPLEPRRRRRDRGLGGRELGIAQAVPAPGGRRWRDHAAGHEQAARGAGKPGPAPRRGARRPVGAAAAAADPGPQRRHGGRRHSTLLSGPPQSLRQLRRRAAQGGMQRGEGAVPFGERGRQGERVIRRGDLDGSEQVEVSGRDEGDERVVRARGPAHPDDHLRLGHERVQVRGRVAGQPGRQHLRLPRTGRQHRAGQALQGEEDLVGAGAGAVVEEVGGGEEARVGALRDRLKLTPRRRQAAPAQAPEHLGIHELLIGHPRREPAGDEAPGRHLALEDQTHRRRPEPECDRRLARGEGAVGAGEAGDQLGEGVAALGGGGRGVPVRYRHAQRVAQQPEVRGGRQVGCPREPHRGHPACQLRQRRVEIRQRHPLREGGKRDGPEQAGELGQVVDGGRPALRRGVLQLGHHLRHHVGVQQLPQIQRAEGGGQQLGIHREHRGAPLGQGGVAVVHEGAGVAEEECRGERAGRLGGDLDQPNPA